MKSGHPDIVSRSTSRLCVNRACSSSGVDRSTDAQAGILLPSIYFASRRASAEANVVCTLLLHRLRCTRCQVPLVGMRRRFAVSGRRRSCPLIAFRKTTKVPTTGLLRQDTRRTCWVPAVRPLPRSRAACFALFSTTPRAGIYARLSALLRPRTWINRRPPACLRHSWCARLGTTGGLRPWRQVRLR